MFKLLKNEKSVLNSFKKRSENETKINSDLYT